MISKDRIKLLPHWCITETSPAFYDTESKTAIGQTAKLYGAMRELQEDYNNYVNEINAVITDFINNVNADQEEFINSINKIVHDYIAMLDEKIKMQDEIIEESILDIRNNMISSLQEILNQMVESGELDAIILNLFNELNDRVETLEKTKTVKTVSEMKALTDLTPGTIVNTIGYYSANDGGGATYLIREKTGEEIEDNGAIHFINDGLVAELVIKNSIINPKQFGVYSNGTNDDYTQMQKLIDFCVDEENKECRYKIKGNKENILLSRSLKLSAYTILEDCSFKPTPNGIYTNNYLILINTTDGENWRLEYPRAYIGKIENCNLINFENNKQIVSGLNGIINCASYEFNDILSRGFNKTLKTEQQYLDNCIYKKIRIMYPFGTDYKIDVGYLGDNCEMDQIHIDTNADNQTAEYRKNVYVGGGHNGILLKNLILTGTLFINGGNVSVENLHCEQVVVPTIIAENATLKLKNIYLYGSIVDNMQFNYSNVVLENCKIRYNMKGVSYQDYTDNNITLTKTNLVIINSYKYVINSEIKNHYNTSLKIAGQELSVKPIQYFYGDGTIISENKATTKGSGQFLDYPSINDQTQWFEETGTYYYKCIGIVDFERMVRNGSSEKVSNHNLTKNEKGFSYSTVHMGLWRWYRGNSENMFNKYVDFAQMYNGACYDNGFIVNGNKWIDRNESDIETYNIATERCWYEGDLFRGFLEGIPTVGAWKRGDEIYLKTPNNNIYGYRCIKEGTPGTWIPLTYNS